MIKLYRKKPVEIEAVQWTGHNPPQEMYEFFHSSPLGVGCYEWFYDAVTENVVLMIHTLEGVMKVNNGDYIIKGVKGEFYPCRQDIFEETYELAEGR